MQNPEAKPVRESQTTLSEVMIPVHTNHYGNVNGGTIMKMVDEAAFVVATRHARCNVVTASIDKMVFRTPVLIGDILIINAALAFVGRASMDVEVKIETEKLKDGVKVEVGSAYVTMVALGPDGRPARVPGLIMETEEDRSRNSAAIQRRQRRNQ
jgi:acyl-CoA hydrolase